MLELAIAGNPAFSVCRYETDRGGVNYTVDTLGTSRRRPWSRAVLSAWGRRALAPAPWRNAGRVCELAVPVAVGRPGCGPIDFESAGDCHAERIELIGGHQVEMPEIGIGGTELLRRVRSGRSIRYCVPPAVELYIKANGVYGAGGGEHAERKTV